MLNSLCFTPGTCEVIHNRAGIIKSLCWYKTVEGEKQSRNTRDVCWRRDLELPGQRKAERIQELQILLFVPSRLAGRGASLVIAGKHLQINNPVIKGNYPVWVGRGAWFVLYLSETPMPAGSAGALQKDRHCPFCCSLTLSCWSCCDFAVIHFFTAGSSE